MQVASPSHDIIHSIYFEKWFVEGGSASFFSSGMEVVCNGHSSEYEWWYYCDKLKELVKFPAGHMVPPLPVQFISPDTLPHYP